MKKAQKDALEEMMQLSLRAMAKKGQKPSDALEVTLNKGEGPCEDCGMSPCECDDEGDAEAPDGQEMELTPDQVEKLRALFSASKE